MRKYLIVLALMLPLITFAQTTSSTANLQILIDKLQAQIQSLETQIADIKSQMQSVNTELKFSRVLTQGATGDDVKQLQEFLKTYTGSYPDGKITGYYGPLTAVAVKKFQEQNGIESVGIVGPKTQEKLNVLVAAIPATQTTPAISTIQTSSATPVAYAGQTSPALPISQTATIMPASQTTTSATPIILATHEQPGNQITDVLAKSQSTTPSMPTTLTTPSAVPYPGTEVQTPPTTQAVTTSGTPCRTPASVQTQYSPTIIKVLSPNGGEQWQMNKINTIKYSVENIAGNKALLIYLNKGYDAPTTKTGVNSSQLIGVTTNLESYSYMLPYIAPGDNYTITIMAEGSYSSCDAISYVGDSSDAIFSIIASVNNVPIATPTTTAIPVTTTSGGGYGTILNGSSTPTQ